MQPTRVETYTTAQLALQRLVQLGARDVPDKSTSARKVYYSGQTKTWMTMTRSGFGFRLETYAACPCS